MNIQEIVNNNTFIRSVNRLIEAFVRRKGLDKDEWHLGVVTEVISRYRLKVIIDDYLTEETVPCNPDIIFQVGDNVWVQYINKNSFDKFVPSKRSVGTESIPSPSGGGNGNLTKEEIIAVLGYTPEDSANKGSYNGYAELNESGKIPSSQLPSYVDDVLEYDDFDSLPVDGESGKIYITKDDNKTYRWSGTGYVEISQSLALGETSSTAYRGDKGKIAFDHSQLPHAPANIRGFSTVSASSNVFTLDIDQEVNFLITLDDGIDKYLVFDNIPQTNNFILNVSVMVICEQTCIVTMPDSVIWQNNDEPTFLANSRYLLIFTSYDKGETWNGSWLGTWSTSTQLDAIVFDDFNRVDNSNTLGNAVTGQTWQYSSGAVFGISGGKAKAFTTGYDVAVIDSGVSDCTVSVRFMSANPPSDLCFRYTNDNNYWIAGRSTGEPGKWYIGRVNNGNFEVMQYPSEVFGIAAGDECKVVLNGSSIKLYVNDVFIAEEDSSFNISATKHGFYSEESTVPTFDDFKVVV